MAYQEHQVKKRAAGVLLAVLAVACGSSPATPANATGTLTALATQPVSPTPSPTQFVATASPTPGAIATAVVAVDPLAIADPCLVGRWMLTSLAVNDSISFPGFTMSMTGQVGTVMTLGADGTEIFDLTNSTRLNGVGGGHTMSWLGRGVQRFGFQGRGGQWTESGPPQIATAANVVVDGVSQPDFNSEAPPFSGSYTCAGSNLTMAIDLPSYSQTATFKK
jgi:hypothetical protein